MDRPLTEVVRGTFAPYVIVVATQEAHDACLRRGTTPVALFRDSLVPSRGTVQGPDRVYQLRDFAPRFVEIEDYGKTTETSDRALYEYLLETPSGLPLDPSTPLPVLSPASATPWYPTFRNSFLTTIRCADHEYLELPVACVFLISTANKDATNTFLRLYKPSNSPPMFPDGFTDPNIGKFHLLLHELADCTLSAAEKNLTELRKTFGKDCQMLSLVAEAEGGPNQEGWKKVTKDFVDSFIAKNIIPHMQSVIAKQNEVVQASRKTFVSTMTSFMGLRAFSRPKAKDNLAIALPFSPMTTRLLADWMFLTQMYDAALTQYRNLVSDLRSEKEEPSITHVAGAQEMTALCMIMLEGVGVRKDAEQMLENALDGYARSKSDKARYHSVRCAMFLAHTLASKNMHRNAAAALEKASLVAPPLLAPVLLEQAGLCFLSVQPQSVRKYGYGQVQAAEHYRAVGLVEHALRCGSRGYRIYHGTGWQSVDDSLHSLLGRSSFLRSIAPRPKHNNNSKKSDEEQQGPPEGAREWALFFMGQLLVSCGQGTAQQASNLREYVHAHRTLSAGPSTALLSAFCPPSLPIPGINYKSLRVLVTQYDAPTSSASEAQWTAMTDKLLALRQPRSSPSDHLLSVIHEYIYVDVEVTNPLPLPIQLTSLQLLCQHGTQQLSESDALPAFETEPFDLLLRPTEKKKLLLSVLARKTGQMKILGLAFHLMGQVWGYRSFKDDQLLHSTTTTKASDVDNTASRSNGNDEKEKEKESHSNSRGGGEVIVEVTDGMPLLQATLEGVPRIVLLGQRIQALLRVSNVGPEPLDSVSVSLSHPDFFAIASPEGPDAAAPSSVPIFPQDDEDDNTILRLPFLSGLAAGESVSFPVFLHPCRTGSHSLRLLFYYEPLKKNGTMKFRLHRVVQDVVVKDSLRVEAHTCSSSPTRLGWRTLRLLLHNYNASPIRLQQLSSISPDWDIAPLPVSAKDDSTTEDTTVVESFCSRTLFFSILPKGVLSTTPSLHTDLLMWNGDALSDSKSWPYKQLMDAEMRVVIPRVLEPDPGASRHDQFGMGAGIGLPPFSPQQENWMQAADLRLQRENSQSKELRLPLVLLWTTVDNKAAGQHHLFNLPYLARPVLSVSPLDAHPSLNLPIVYSLRAPSLVKHDFTKQRMCIVDILVIVKNTLLPSCTLHLAAAPKDNNSRKTALRELWMGATRHKLQLQKGEEKQCRFQVCFCENGVFEVGRFKLTIVGGNSNGTFLPPHFVRVVPVDS